MELYRPPGFTEALEIIRETLRRDSVVVLAGLMRVEYEGRGATRLTPGERLLIIKQDRAVLIHRPTGYSPTNWQPNTSIIEAKINEDNLELLMVRKSPRELLRAIFLKPPVITVYYNMSDQGEFIEYLDEHEIRDILYDNPSLLEEGLRPLEKEKPIGEAGYADIYAIDSDNTPTIIEIKRVTADHNAVLQLQRYLAEYKRVTGLNARGILVAPAFTKQAIREAVRLGVTLKQVNPKILYEQYYKRIKEKEHASLLDYL